jgi:hypothetical protein
MMLVLQTQVRSSAMLVLPIAGNEYKVWHNDHADINSVEIGQLIQYQGGRRAHTRAEPRQ